MLNNHGFNLWANGYDKSVNAADENNQYPFAGYRELMNTIYGTIMNKRPATILDIGIGTGTLAHMLYQSGNTITGVDFSSKMLSIASAKMPGATLIQHDFTQGLPPQLNQSKYDFIVSTYALHHLTDEEKLPFIQSLLGHLNENGTIIIGDVSFNTRSDLEACENANEDEWDDDEHYFVFSELESKLSGKCSLSYQQVSHCSGIMVISQLK